MSAKIKKSILGKEASLAVIKMAPNMTSSCACNMAEYLKELTYLHVYSM
jgi:hypothetical protein